MPTYTLSDLSAVDCLSASISYNTAGADVLTLSGLAPAWVEKLGWTRWEKIVLTTDDGVPLFVGRVTEGREMVVQGGSAPRATFTAQSDFAILDMTAYVDVNEQGIPTVAAPFLKRSSKTPTVSMQKVIESCFNGATSSYMTSSLSCSLNGQTIPVGQTGSTSCAQLMLSALEWAPDAVIRMGYDSAASNGSGLLMLIDESADLDPVTISATGSISQGGQAIGSCDGVTEVSLRPRPDLVLPGAALIGAQHYSIGGGARVPGAFVYCVTREKPKSQNDPEAPEDDVPAFTSPYEKKTIITGIPIPPRTTRDGENYNDINVVDAVTHKALAHSFPILAKLGQGNYRAGAPLLNVTPVEDFRPADESTDKDAGAPRNYDTAFVYQPNNAFIHVDGNFPASSRPSRNISGLKWCKAELRLVVAVDELPEQLTREEAEAFFKGKKRDWNGKPWRYADLSIQCTIINAARRIVRGVKPLEEDPEYDPGPETPEEEEEALEPEPNYKALIDSYYQASQTLCHEGSVTLLAPAVHPSSILGRGVRMVGKMPEWASMTAICRAITYDLTSRRMMLSLGSRDTLGWDMRLERAQLALQRERSQRDQEEVYDPLTPPPGPEEEEEEPSEEDALMVSPSINAGFAASSSGRPHRAFEVYEQLGEDGQGSGTWVMQGGSVWIGKKELKIPTTSTQMTAGKATSGVLSDPRTAGRVQRRIYRNPSSNEWTFDISQNK